MHPGRVGRAGPAKRFGSVTAKLSICGWDAFCKSSVYAAKITCLTPGDLPDASEERSWAPSDRCWPSRRSQQKGRVGGAPAEGLNDGGS